MDTSFALTLQIVLTVLAGVTAQVIGEIARVPSIIFLLLFGIGLGPDGIGLLHPQDLGIGLEVIVALSVALILFEGGLSLELSELGQVSNSLRNLVTIGIFVTLIGGGMAAHWLGEFPWSLAFLYASLVVVTGPTVIGPLLRQVAVDRKVATLLEGEGVLIDPIGAILAVVVLDIILNGDADPTTVVGGLILRLSIGTLIGLVGGGLMGLLLKQASFLGEDLRNLTVLAGLWGLFGLAQSIRSEAGLMTTVVAGMMVRWLSVPDERLLRRFKGQLTVLAVSVLFILLAADLSIASVFALGQGAVLTVLVLMVVVRPVNVWLCTRSSDLNWRQKLFLGWVAPRGIVSASVASLFAILLTERGISGGEAIKALVFLTIIMTVMVQGLTARFVAGWLGITKAAAVGAVIVGCSPLSLLIARLIKEYGDPVVIIDTNDAACNAAKKEGIELLISSALDRDVLERAGLDKAGTFLAMTKNGEVNAVVAQRALEEFQPARVVAVVPQEKSLSELPNQGQLKGAQTPRLALKQWNTYLTDGEVRLGETWLRQENSELQQAHLATLIDNGAMVPLLVERDDALRVALGQERWEVGDRMIYLWHDSKPKLLKQLAGGIQPTRLTLETLPMVEAVPPAPKDPLAETAIAVALVSERSALSDGAIP
ncbi:MULTISPECIES: sodium:proton antiporter [Cyanophyceae]|uniref:cation:proton antiporter n=1 Tax=Cyanophyceae TaxID=3028117 RepID=UPI001685FFAE|nr:MULTISPECIES: sodium:proton antiporter [Cyanophyceae]MBD1917512.1 cation:proton antiporter [Phormidium sp. FACHB-77]MBD2029613.1 cation:proton antiporter [Phormidium sp. FACHB-322]MBD2050874.1 cation:proton antiporter [Leptolyngbya sp. FACHB-60]